MTRSLETLTEVLERDLERLSIAALVPQRGQLRRRRLGNARQHGEREHALLFLWNNLADAFKGADGYGAVGVTERERHDLTCSPRRAPDVCVEVVAIGCFCNPL
jgi:hypothetical protein